eukprot:scaffold21013_cov63-Phaeocystis_antarctica.AAC.9
MGSGEPAATKSLGCCVTRRAYGSPWAMASKEAEVAFRTPAPCARREKTARVAPDSSSLSPPKVAAPSTMGAVRLPMSSTILALTTSSGGGWSTTRLTRPESVGTCCPSTSIACTTGDHGSTALAWRGGSMASAPPMAVTAPPFAPKASAAKARRTGTPGESALKVRLVRAGCNVEAKSEGITAAISERPSPPLSTAASASGVTRSRRRASPPGRSRHATAEPRWCGAPGTHGGGSPPPPPSRHTCTRV